MNEPQSECPEIQEHIHDWVDRELDRDVAAGVARHVEQCVPCAQIARSIQSLKMLVRAKATEVPIPKRLESKVREAIALETLRVERKKVIRMPLSQVRWVAAAAIIAVMIPVGFISFNTPDLHAQITNGAFESHARTMTGEATPRFRCVTRSEAESSLKEGLGLDVRLPEFGPGVACLKGVDFESLSGVKVGKVSYKIDDSDFSIFVAPKQMRGGEVLCCCKSTDRLKVFCSNEGGYCFTYVTSLEAEKFRTEVLEPALKRSIEFPPAKKPYSAKHPEER